MVPPEKDQECHDDGNAYDVPVDAEIVESGGEPDAPDVDQHLGNHDQHHHEDLEVPARGRPEDGDRSVCGDVEDAGDGPNDVDRGGDVDAGRDGDLADHVEPRGGPGPAPAAQPVGPEVEPSRRRVRRRQLRHRRRNAERQHTDQRPPDGVDDRPGELETVAVEKDGTRQDRNDRE